ncbi:hypothetical protein [Kitasatospora sp. NBC_01266]|uniref:hypothetical protein n=1 Tax=Kitasatospora sp. NBC_01266 TaxID=2903572 RepID=UPI002E345F0E|nr:hypothetical protein [Kitasatospora sp. NBC_01266]
MKILKSLGLVTATVLLGLGMSGGPAMAATVISQAHQSTRAAEANATSTNLNTGETSSDVAPGAPGATDDALPAKADSLSCWDATFNGSTFAISCSGNYFYVYVNCSNGYRYTYGPLDGSYRVSLTCPNRSRALSGGAYGS